MNREWAQQHARFVPLLRKSDAPKSIPFSSAAASLKAYINLPAGYTCYGASKAAANHAARKIHYENEWISEPLYLLGLSHLWLNTMSTACFPLAPGIVKTEMGERCPRASSCADRDEQGSGGNNRVY
ncbi:hypothetical protein P691DRAFT_371854 [Macrolepiota fuliginosa MF-IS2]|uniref:Uncharacterized protein n=1 Tax=Macrolepiota fuliginosa MF-IS2 TaxID=1400762 RepID=A0A9P5X4M7_9AGAR|nr:hypothetical protein P691DRAFT_371854 [Macrolepiota fuliginosa MF-IS2]